MAWHEEDRIWMLCAPLIFREERVVKTVQQVEDLVALLGLRPGQRVLDLCCGQGRHAIELARRGFRVTGVDRTEAFIQQAEQQSKAEGLEIEWLVDDVRRFARPGAFDAALCLGQSFSYFDTREDDERFVRLAFDSLVPGGPFVLEADGKELMARTLEPRQWWELGDVVAVAEFTPRRSWEILETRWQAFIGGERVELTTTQRMYSGVEGIALLEKCGFTEVAVYGHQDGRPYDLAAELQVMVGRRPRG